MDDDLLGRWGVQVARWAARDETALAAQTTRAYAAGGRARQDLFRTGGLAPGGFGGGLAVVLPALLDALAYAADAVKAALGSQQFANTIAATALLVGLRAQRGTGQEPPAPDRTSDAADAGGWSRGASPPSGEAVRAAFDMCRRLRARGVDAALAEELAAELTARLLNSGRRDDIASFLDALVANEPPVPGTPTVLPRQSPLRRLAGAASGLLHRRGAAGTGPAGSGGARDETDDV
ncbi:hypothetical protein [Streptomyces sp. NPDC047000]|uniref:hypothetical protein n=1 Tax=Streptomyces sp. NPDC047000 TaxID=3155474 RepID=UPI00340479CE